MNAVMAFLGSATLRMGLEKLAGVFELWILHKQELELMQVRARIDADTEARALIRLETEAKLGVIAPSALAENAEGLDASTFERIANAQHSTGVKWLDTLNAIVRPFSALISLFAWCVLLGLDAYFFINFSDFASRTQASANILDFTFSLISAVLGWFFMSRGLINGKK